MSVSVRIVLIVIIGCGITVQKESEKGDSSIKPSIAIVGAGISGLSTARRLIELGIDDFDIYEGLDRIGGRIHAIPYKDGFLQMGAQFINGAENPLYKIANRLGLIADVVSDTAHVDNAHFAFGSQNVREEDIKTFLDFTSKLDPKYRSIAKHDEKTARRYTFKEIFTLDYMHFLKSQNFTDEQKNVFDSLARSFRSYWEFEWAADWSTLSVHVLKEWNDYGPECESFATNKIGFKAILDDIAAPISGKAFNFNSRVENIKLNSNTGRIQLTVNDHIVPTEYDYVIVTSSLGVLKKYHHKMFTPPLPRQKIEAIEKIGFGGSCKIFFEWETPFWSNNTYSIAPLPVRGMISDRLDAFEEETTILQVVDWAPNVLSAWYAGRGHQLVDNMSEEELKQRITQLMRDMYSDKSIPLPSKIIRTQLTKNELLLGSYSYMTQVQALSHISHSQLAIPVKLEGRPKILFAGEATHHRLFQTTIGGYLSGRREADRAVTDWFGNRFNSSHSHQVEPGDDTFINDQRNVPYISQPITSI
uniref:Amino_oxidase domain-containing protein n=1 Tax=Caenorhabditis tropicalis TaxID=1561998 RepID=A0A1I7U9B5_9PELO